MRTAVPDGPSGFLGRGTARPCSPNGRPIWAPRFGAPKGVAKRVARPGGPHGHPSLGARIIARLGLPPARARLGHSVCAHWGRDVEGSPRQAGRRHPTRPVGSAVAPVPGLGASPPRNPGGRARKPMVACLPGRAAQPDAPPLGALSRPRRRTVMTKNRGNDSSPLVPKEGIGQQQGPRLPVRRLVVALVGLRAGERTRSPICRSRTVGRALRAICARRAGHLDVRRGGSRGRGAGGRLGRAGGNGPQQRGHAYRAGQ